MNEPKPTVQALVAESLRARHSQDYDRAVQLLRDAMAACPAEWVPLVCPTLARMLEDVKAERPVAARLADLLRRRPHAKSYASFGRRMEDELEAEAWKEALLRDPLLKAKSTEGTAP